MSNISKRWLWLGLKKHPFPAPPHADFMTPDEISRTFVYDQKDADSLLGDGSTVMLAPFGGGKTMSRIYFGDVFKKRKDTLVVFVDFFLLDDRSHPLTEEHRTSFLLKMIATAVWEVVTTRPNRFVSLSISKQGWWWALLRNHLFGEERMEIALDRSSALEALKLSFEKYGMLYAFPFSSNDPLYSILHDIQQNIIDFDFEKLVFLVDNSDRTSENNPDNIQQDIAPFFEDISLYKQHSIYWKWFLSDTVRDYIVSTRVHSSRRLEITTIEWTKKELTTLLKNRLSWASGDDGEESSSGFSLYGCSDETLKNKINLDEQLILLSWKYRKFQEELGDPRTLLTLGRCFVNNLSDIDVSNPDLVLIKEDEWEKFESLIEKSCLENSSLKQDNSRNVVPLQNTGTGSIIAQQVNRDARTENKRIELFNKLKDNFNIDEIKTICFELYIDFENLSGNGKEGKTRELVLFVERTRRIKDLTTICQQKRPKTAW